jgi:arylsulfatase A-like enzyme
MFTTAPQCAPSRASFATGRSPVAAQASRFTSGVPRSIELFPQILRREAGYFTGIIRRSHHLDPLTDHKNATTREIVQRHQLDSMPQRFDHIDMGGTHLDTVQKTEAFFEKLPPARPFFLWVNFNDPHHVWDAPAKNDPKRLPMPPDLPGTPEMRADFARYLDEIVRLDEEFQSVLDVLRRRGFSENTIVIFVGDNGAPLPRGKGSLYDRGLNVPLFVRWPGQVAPGARSTALISGEDFAPTLLEAAGLKPVAAMSGKSFLPLLRGDTAHPAREFIFAIRGVHGSAILTEKTSSNGVDLGRAVRSARHKLILNYTPWIPYGPVDCNRDPGWQAVLTARERGTLSPLFEQLYFTTPRPLVELYDLETDPAETRNLAGDPAHAAVERQLKIALQERMILDYDYLPLPLND